MLASFCILGGIGWYIHDAFSAPSVVAGNWDFQYKKIPYNVPSIDITLSHNIDPKTVNANSFKISPFVPGRPEVKDGNTLRYVLDKNLEIGKRYLLGITPDIQTTLGVALSNTLTFEIEAVGGVEVTRMIPDAETTALGKNPLFIFNIPVVSTSSLKKRDTLPCPVVFTPSLEGVCSWTSGNILEYKTKYPLSAATKYEVRVELGKEFLYPMSQAFSGSFSTPRLDLITGKDSRFVSPGIQRCDPQTDKGCLPEPPQVFTPKDKTTNVVSAVPINQTPVSFSPSRGIEIAFTAPIKSEDLQKSLVLVERPMTESISATLDKINTGSFASLPFRLVSPSNTTSSHIFSIERTDAPL